VVRRNAAFAEWKDELLRCHIPGFPFFWLTAGSGTQFWETLRLGTPPELGGWGEFILQFSKAEMLSCKEKYLRLQNISDYI
jgi:hypothetical protein